MKNRPTENTDAAKEPDALDAGVEAVTYGLPLVLMDLTRKKMSNVAMPDSTAAPLNQFAHATEFPDASFKDVVRANVPGGFEEGIEFGMISWHVPLARYPDTYNGRPLGIAALASQKRYMSLYLMGIYSDEAESSWFRDRWTQAGKRLDMGKSCVRFRRLDDVPLDVLAEAVGRTTVDQLLARVVQLVGHFLLAGAHHAGLHLDQQAGHVEEIANRVDVDLLQNGQVIEVLLRDL